MKAFILSLCFILSSAIASAQGYAVINDKDGFVNIRKGPGINTSIIGKLYTDDIFGYDDLAKNSGEWIKIYRVVSENPDGNIELGFISKTRTTPISSFASIHHKNISGQQATINNDSVKVTITTTAFKKAQHKLAYQKTATEKPWLNKIDSKPFWGTDGEIPKKSISSVLVTVNNVPVVIPQTAFNDLYEPAFRSFDVYLGPKNTIYIQMNNSDGAGAYTVIWIIKNNKYLKRFIDNSEV
ncbi:SH3 domain-containing protein [Mucilaginibacter sp. CAU 1740]|uniref:SH3 domain-containing protein n=1 Tax=Mucilaginibacter sp. CAU 1740 TaxID=3140365 RepID=UPI00325A76BA